MQLPTTGNPRIFPVTQAQKHCPTWLHANTEARTSSCYVRVYGTNRNRAVLARQTDRPAEREEESAQARAETFPVLCRGCAVCRVLFKDLSKKKKKQPCEIKTGNDDPTKTRERLRSSKKSVDARRKVEKERFEQQ